MKSKRLLMALSLLIAVTTLTGCGIFRSKDKGTQYAVYNFPEDEPVKPLNRINNKNNPYEVIDFARSLSKAGRYKESALIYLDAAERFKSRTGTFEINCRMAAVKEFWFAGDLTSAHNELKSLEEDQDIYSYSSETKAIRKLRTLLYNTDKITNGLRKAEQKEV